MTSSTNIDADDQLPRVFGRYLLLRRLSRGGMGEIFLAKHGLSGFEKLCVIKKILPQLSADRHFISRFVDEAQVAIHLQHANVAQVFEVGCVGNEYFLSLEYIEGRDLRRTLSRLKKKRRQFPVDLALLVARDLANGLAYAHRRTSPDGDPLNLVHCDISPPNVVLSFEGEVKIIDFGIAKSAMRVTVTDPKMGFGKFGYMSPEQLVRGGQVDQRTDIYAAGTVLYEMLTGTRLHNVGGKSDYRAVVKQVLDGKHAKPSDIDIELTPFDDLVLRAVHPKVKSRFQTAGEMRDAVQKHLVLRNPTISSDSLAAFMRDLFHEDIQELQQLAVTAHATEMAPWQHQIADQSVSSVSFASAHSGSGNEAPTNPVPNPVPGPRSSSANIASNAAVTPAPPTSGDDGAAAPAPLVIESRSQRPGRADDQAPTTVWRGSTNKPQGRADTPLTPLPQQPIWRDKRAVWVVVGLLLVAIIGVLAMLLSGDSSDSRSAVQTDAGAADAREPDVTDAGLATDAAAAPDAGKNGSARNGTRPRIKKKPPKPVATGPTRQQVEQKFQRLQRAYKKFRKNYGSQLEDRWADLAHDIQFARSPDKLKALNGRLDAFQADMRRVKSTAP